MILYIDNHTFHFEMENICRLFMPMEKIRTQYLGTDAPCVDETAVFAYAGIKDGQAVCRLHLQDYDQTRTRPILAPVAQEENSAERLLAELLYLLLCDAFATQSDWGILTGVRPIKLLRRLSQGHGEQQAVQYLRERLLVSETKAELCRETMRHENAVLALSRPESFSLYISIPFCPTRCDYCSFVSQTAPRAGHLMEPYVQALCREIEQTGNIARGLGLRLETVYFGGGTPTTLSAEQLAMLLATVERSFDLSTVREYTVEAGRPDTVTREKLETLRAAAVSRISINPQTLHDEVLQAIGRRHTVEQFYQAFDLARCVGLNNINPDLIAGLSGDTQQGFAQTLQGIIDLRPESVTVHTLSLKRAANLVIRNRTDASLQTDTRPMIAQSAALLPQAGYHPYYLYRQSRTVGNQENVGWSLPGYEGLYNVYIMDESHTILACGAGAVTKLKQPDSDYLERIFNYKFPYEYINGFSEMLARKEGITSFYAERCGRKL